MSNIAYTPRRTAWDVTWNANGLGTVYEVNPDLKLITDPIRRGTTGKVILGHWIIGLEGVIKVQCADLTLPLQQQMFPWWTSGAIPLVPETPQQNMYQYAQELVLHPHDLPAATTTEDVHLIKTVPMQILNIKRDGVKDEVFEVTFQPYPDLSRLQAATPFLDYGYIGTTAI
jgi:hypothetical protein